MPLDAIVPVPGVQEYLLEHWIEASDLERAKREDGADCYHDGTYDWYAGFAVYAKPRNILEIGVYRGYSAAAMMCRLSDAPSYYVGVDVCKDADASVTDSAVTRLMDEDLAHVATFVQFDTQAVSCDMVQTATYDLVHIDADHAYEACRNDLTNFAPMCVVGGIVVIHDTEDPNVAQAVMDYYNDHRSEFDIRNIPTVNGNIVMERKAACGP